jgi:hypothetical protein
MQLNVLQRLLMIVCCATYLVPSRQEIIKLGGVTTLASLLDTVDTKLQACVCVCLSRLLLESQYY